MLYKLFTSLTGLCALICPIAFFVSLIICPYGSVEETIAAQVSAFSFAMFFTFGLASLVIDEPNTQQI